MKQMPQLLREIQSRWQQPAVRDLAWVIGSPPLAGEQGGLALWPDARWCDAELERMVPVHRVVDLTLNAELNGYEKPIERDLAMVKVSGKGENRVEAMRLAEAFRAQVIDASTEHFTFEITGRISKIEHGICSTSSLPL